MKYDVAIIGAGVVGALTARALSRYQCRVVLLEAADDVAGGASRANSGIVHGGFDPKPGTKKAELNVRGAAMMPSLCRDLGVRYRPNGSLVLGFDSDDLNALISLFERGKQNGVPGLSLLSGDEVRQMESAISPAVRGALLCESAGIVCPYGLTIAAAGNAMDNGAELCTNFPVDRVDLLPDGFRLHAGDAWVEASYVVNCAGLFADRIAAMIGDRRFTVIPKKGEYMLLDRSAGQICRHTLFQVPSAAGKGVLVSPTADGNLLIGPTSVAIEDRTCRDTTAEGLAAVRTAAAKTIPDLPYRDVITSFTGLRASLAGEEDFVLCESSVSPCFVHAMGIDSPGLSSAPAIAEELLSLLRRAGLKTEEKPGFCPTRPSYHRFADAAEEEKNAVIAKEPAYGHIICRCESVSEGEILDAIHRNPPARSLDAVKRRVRAGMGRCQGGFCSTYVTELLARESGSDMNAVTKFGAGSELLFQGEGER